MVLPFLAAGLLGARFLIPKLLPVAARFGRALIPGTIRGKLFAFAAVPTLATAVVSSPTVRRGIGTVFDPRVGIQRGKAIAERVEGLGKEEKESVIGSIAKFGAAGAVIGGVAVAVPKIAAKVKERRAAKEAGIIAEKPITPETQIIQTTPVTAPVSTIGKPMGVNINVNVTQRQTRRIKNIVVFQ